MRQKKIKMTHISINIDKTLQICGFFVLSVWCYVVACYPCGQVRIFDFIIDRMHKWRPKKYSFVFVLIRLTSLVRTEKIQKKCSFRTRLVLIRRPC